MVHLLPITLRTVVSSVSSATGLARSSADPALNRTSVSILEKLFPVISITRSLADEILSSESHNIADLEKKLNQERKPHSFNTSAKVNAVTDLIRKSSVTQNIIAILPGKDELLKNEYIIIGAHYDHLGYGGAGSGSRMPDTTAIHPGADDNASGVSCLIELAGVLSERSDLKRSIIFVAFGAEEMGLVGSKYFMAHPPVEKEKIYTMINLDMMGRMKKNDPFLSVSGTGTAVEFDSLLNTVEKNRSFQLQRSPEGYGPSDHASFYSEGIPVLFFTTGAHSDYHTPEDKAGRIIPESMAESCDMITDLIVLLSGQAKKLTYREAGNQPTRRHGRKLKVTLGIIPDVSSSQVSGLLVTGVKKDGPAAASGILSGDVITSINGMEVKNIYDYMQRLNQLKTGETAIVEINRKGETKVVLVQL